MKGIANILTTIRLFSLIPITILVMLRYELLAGIIFLISLGTDLFDGYLARKTKSATKAGAEYDSIVDHTFIAFSLWWILVLRPEIAMKYIPYGLGIALLELTYGIISTRVAGRILGLHLWLGKITMGLVALLFPIIILIGDITWYAYGTILITALSRVENIIYVASGRTDVNGKTIFL